MTTNSASSENSRKAQKKSLSRLIVYLGINIVAIALIFTGLSLIFWIARPYASLFLSSSQKTALEKKAKTGMVKDNRIIIPSVLVDAPVIEGFTKEALEKGIGHVSGSAQPGEKGNIVLAGHNYAYFMPGEQNLFSLLHLVKKNAKIYIFYEGKRYIYTVKDKKQLPKDDPAIFIPTPYERLTLIASGSSWTRATISSTERLVVVAYPAKNAGIAR